MPLDKDRLKAQLMKKYSEQLDKMLDELDKPDRLHLTEIEDAALSIRKQVSQDVTERLSHHESQHHDVDVCCPSCGKQARLKGQKSKWVKTRSGEVQVKRPYYYCTSCQTGFSPLDNYWRLDKRGYSHQLAYQMVWLSGHVPFAVAQDIWHQMAQLDIGVTTLWEQTQYHGERLRQYDLAQQQQTRVERTRWTQAQYDAFSKRNISIDGGMVNIRAEGWKEFKVGLVSDFEQHWDTDSPHVKLVDMHYTAVVGDVDTFAPALWKLAVEQDVPYAGSIVAVCDGAQWIWRLVGDLFPVCTQILDWYHARQQLAKLAHDCFADNERQAQQWYHRMSDKLFQGQIADIIAQGEQHQQSTTYFVNQQRRMQYQQFQAQGFPIGSGGIESGIKQYKQRVAGAGMRWSRPGVERLMVIRSAILSDTFADLWQQVA